MKTSFTSMSPERRQFEAAHIIGTSERYHKVISTLGISYEWARVLNGPSDELVDEFMQQSMTLLGLASFRPSEWLRLAEVSVEEGREPSTAERYLYQDFSDHEDWYRLGHHEPRLRHPAFAVPEQPTG